jgi:hypothetical protein
MSGDSQPGPAVPVMPMSDEASRSETHMTSPSEEKRHRIRRFFQRMEPWQQVLAACVGGFATLLAAIVAVKLAPGQKNDAPNGARSTEGTVTAASAHPPSPPSVSPLNPQQVILHLANSPIPQRSWNATTRKASIDPADFAVECRLRQKPRTGCVSGQPAVYHLLPNAAEGVEASSVTVDPTEKRGVCEGAITEPVFVPIAVGHFYCVRTPTRIAGIRVEHLPPASSSITVTLTVSVWER